jgi:peptide chain release factor 3
MSTTEQITRDELVQHVARRRTFAIISHPDAGKTTLTEKLLLYAGAIELAGAVRGSKTRRAVVSDWMDMERERGISLTSTALEFDLDDHRLCLLDTPGHKDFGEDTYRALLAADSVVMVLDAAKGVEDQTRKLFAVSKRHRLPMLTFVNKMDTHGRDPLELIDEIESVLGVHAAPMNWPIGMGDRFRGVYHLHDHEVLLYERHLQGQRRAPVEVSDRLDPRLVELVGESSHKEFLESSALVAAAGASFDREEYLAGRQTAVYFGSALHNFGLEPFLKALTALAPAPRPRVLDDGGLVDPTSTDFSAFVFKIQANMDPRHRDRVAFVRVCSGRLVKDMLVTNERLQAPVRVSRPYKLFGRDRQTAVEAYAGDVVGLVNPGRFAIGDTIYTGPRVKFPPIPRFAAEHFGRLRLDGTKHKQFDEGVRQLEEEGLMQVLFSKSGGRDPIVGVVGALQFDVIAARMKSEYGVDCRAEPLNYITARAIENYSKPAETLEGLGSSVLVTTNRAGREILLFPSAWALDYAERQNPGVTFAMEIEG